MKILYITPLYYPHIGGVEYVVKSIAERLVKIGHEVTVVAGEPTISMPKEEEINGVLVVRWPTYAPNGAYHVPRKRTYLIKKLTKLIDVSDVLHIHNIHTVLAYFGWKAWRNSNSNVKLCITPYYHKGGHTFIRDMLWRFWKAFVHNMLNEADIIHTVSKLESKFIKEDFGVNALPIENGVDESIFKLDWNAKNYVLYAGRIEKYKNIHRLGRIIHILNNKFDLNLYFLILGEGPFKKNLFRILSKLNIKTRFLTFQAYDKYLDYLAHAMFFGLISEKESFPQSINEANAIGTPVIISRPWGENFRDRSRTLIINLHESDEKIAESVFLFLEHVRNEPKSNVASWNTVAKLYYCKLYSTK